MKTTLRRVKEGAYSVAPPAGVPHFFAFRDDGGEIVAMVYSTAGAWVEDRGSQAGVVPHLCIVGDTLAGVGDGSAVWNTDDELTVWDVENDVVYTYNPPAGQLLGQARHLNGWLYWWERSSTVESPTTVTFMRALCDLTSAEVVGTAEVENDAGVDNDEFSFGSGHCLNVNADLAAGAYTGGEVASVTRLRMLLSNGSVTHQEHGSVGWGGQHPDAAFTSIGLQGAMQEDDIDEPGAPRWPTTGSWALDNALGIGTSADLTTALSYGTRGPDPPDPLIGWAVEAPTLSGSGEPTLAIEILPYGPGGDPESEHWSIPDALFLME